MSSEYLYVKTVEYLTSVKTEHLMAGSVRTPNNTDIGQMKISKFTMINKQIIFNSAKQTLIMT